MSGLIEAIVVVNLAEKALTAHERKVYTGLYPLSGIGNFSVKLLDATDIDEIRYSIVGTESRFNAIRYREIKCISEAELKQLMEDFEE